MKRVAVKVIVNGKKKKFRTPKKVSLKSFEYARMYEDEFDKDETTNKRLIEILADFLCEVFAHQFTPQQLIDSIPINDVIMLGHRCAYYVEHQMLRGYTR